MRTTQPKKHTAGAFDIRNVIGALVVIYGVILVLAAFALDPGVNPATGAPKNAMENFWAGLVMILVAAAFFAWAKLRPVVVDESKIDESKLEAH
ncbi:hypothetical protein CPHO_11555 [Corynebacterium phocae]|uniref:Cell wall anchor protein n=1 Tax=Corynebacterium phocae TaxID=161895 RepID=A0A1L7D5N0_9CORY|nr:hypothetical protein [Corynebacterium phocae]APT93420.1 hypothetical protein CPHO_11555 [Corynebacterium phocae]KAA8721113.1 hypothetical protein F4V58_11030 [Corynebacterium phocae]